MRIGEGEDGDSGCRYSHITHHLTEGEADLDTQHILSSSSKDS